MDMETVVETALQGDTSIVLQLDVDLACEETFYVTDGEGGEVRCGGARGRGCYIRCPDRSSRFQAWISSSRAVVPRSFFC